MLRTIKDRFLKSDIAKRILSGAFWSFTGTASAKFIVLIAGMICAHILTQTEYGEFSMVRSTINMFVVFGTAGLGLTATKYISEYKKNQSDRICSIYILTNGFAFVTGGIVTTIILIFAPLLATKVLHCSHLVIPIRIGAILLFTAVINGAQTGVLSGFEDFKSIAVNTLKGSLAESVGMLLGAYYWGVTGAIFGFGLGFVVLYISNYISIRKNFSARKIDIKLNSFKKSDISLLYKFSLPAALSSIMVMPTYFIIRSMLARYNGFSEVAIYEAADQWRTIILFIPTAVSNIILPILSSIANVDKSKFWKVLKFNIALNVSIALLLALIVSCCSGLIMGFYGDGYIDVKPLIYLALSTVFSAMANVIGLSIASRARMWIGLSFNFLWAIMVIVFTYVFLSYDMAASGVSLSILCSYIIHSIIQYTYLRFITNNDAVAKI